jgi:hypothetical protein
MVFCGDEVSPRLLVAAGRSPTGGFEKACEDGGLDWLVGEGARTPSMADEIVNGEICGRWLMHGFLPLARIGD